MKQAKEDLRVKKTKKLLCSTILNLMQKRPLEEITVTDICNKAMVHRTTFYTHYEDKYNLLLNALEEIKNLIFMPIINSKENESAKTIFLKIIEAIVDFLYENRTAVLNILKNNRSETIITVIEHAVQEKMDILVEHLNNKLNIEVPLPVIISFFGGGFTSLLLYWIENQNYTKEELLQYVKVLLNINFDD